MRAIETETQSSQASLEQKKQRKRRKILLLLLLVILLLGLTFTSVSRFFSGSPEETASTDPRTPAQVQVIETGEDAEVKGNIKALQSMIASLQQSVQELEDHDHPLPTPDDDLPPQTISYDAYQNLKDNNRLDQPTSTSLLTRETITNEFFLKAAKLVDISDVNEEGLSDGEILKWDEDENEWVAAKDKDTNTTYEAGSGLTLEDEVFSLGGALTENTSLDLAGFSFTLTNGNVTVDDSLYATNLYQNGNEVCDTSGNCSGVSFSMSLAADSGTNQTISDSDTITISGGSGLSSVASATDTVTLNIGAGTGISVGTNDVSVDQSYGFAWTGAQSWSSSADFNGDISLADTDIVLDGASTNLSAAGNFSVNTDDFFVQKTDGNIGIGNTTPGYTLEVTGSIATSDDLYISGIGLNDTLTNTTSGASLIGVFDEFTNSSSTTVQAVLADLDAAIASSSHAPVTLAGAYNYLTLSGQEITLHQIDLATDVTGILPLTNGGTNADLSGVSNGGIIYKGATGLAGSGSLTGVLKGNGSSAPTAMTGTQNYVTRWTDADSIGTGVLYDNATNVGINTTNPGSRLDVVGGSIRADGDVTAGDLYLGFDDTSATISTSDTDETLTLDPNGTGSIFLHGSTYYIDANGLIYASGLATTGYTPTAGELRADVFRDGNSAYYLQPADTAISAVFAGNVGIGTTSPDFALQVNGVIAPETTDQDLGTSSLRWDIFANSINADSTITLTGLSAGSDNTVLLLNASNQVVTDEIDPRVWGSALADGSGTAGYVSYWSDPDTLAAEQYLSTVRGGLGNDVTAAGAGEILYSTGANAYGSLPAGTAGYVLVSNGAAAPTWVDSGALGASYWAKVAGVLSPALAEPIAATSAATTVATFTAEGSNAALQAGGISSYARFNNSGNLVFTNASGASIDASAGLTIGGSTQTGLTLGRSGISTAIANLTTDGVVYTSGGNGTLNSEAQLAISRGGTNSTATPTAGAIAYGTGTAYAFSSAGTIGQAFLSGGGGTPTWGTLGLTYGGTNADLSGVATGGLIYKDATALAGTGALTGVLKGNGASAPTAMAGTTNYVTRWTDANTLGIGILYDDGTNVGIGTTSPDFALQVNGVIAPETTDQNLGTSSLRWNIFANEINADSTITLSGLNVGADNTVLILNGSNQVERREIDPGVWSGNIVQGAGTTNYVAYWSSNDTLTAEQYLNVARGGLGNDITAAGVGELLYSTGTTSYDSLAAGTSGYVLRSNGASAPSWVDPTSLVQSYWQYTNGALSPVSPYTNNSDFLIGAAATESAKFAVLNVFPNSGTPTASVSSGLSGTAMYLTADGTLATQNMMDLTVGNSSTYNTSGNILLHPNGSGNVGVGTTSPVEKLDIYGNGSNVVAQILSGGSSNRASLLLGRTAAEAAFAVAGIATHYSDQATAGDAIIRNTTDDIILAAKNGSGEIKFTTGSSDTLKMVLSNAGNLGIGTSNPSSFKLQVAGSIGPQTNDTYDLGSNTLRWRDLYLGGETIHLGSSTSDEGLISYTSGNILSFSTDSTTNGDIAFFTDDLYLDKSSGNIGIGTTTPNLAKVQIFGGGGRLRIGDDAASTAMLEGIGNLAAVGSANNIPLAFMINEAEVARVSTTGNLGIGTTNPAQALHVIGDARISGLTASLPVKTNATNDLISGAINLASAEVTGILPLTSGGTNADLSGASTGSLIYKGATALQASGSLTGVLKGNGSSAPTAMTGTANYVTRWTDANSLGTGVLYDNGTNVGIGTTTPTSFKLELAGSMGPSGNNAYDLGSDTRRWANVYATSFYQGGNAVCDMSGNCSSLGNLWQYSNGAISPSTPYTNNSDFLIGAAATGSAKFAVLNVFPNSGTPTASVSSGLNGNSMYMTADGTLATTRRSDLTIGNSSTYNTTGNVLINSNGTGNVGVGTTTPGSKLDVQYSANDGTAGIKVGTSGVSRGYVFADGDLRLGIDNNNDATTNAFSIYNNGVVSNELFRVQEDGNVGIGTPAPETALHARQATALGGTASNSQLAHTLEMETSNNVYERTWLYRDSTGTDWLTARVHNGISVDASYGTPGTNTRTWWERDPFDNIQSWGTGSSTYMTLNGSNLGIGTTNPSNLLHIQSTTTPQFRVAYNTTEYLEIQKGTSGTQFIPNGGSSALYIQDDGNVGIGNTAPGEKLEVSGHANTAVVIDGTSSPRVRYEVNDIVEGYTWATTSYMAIGQGSAGDSLFVLSNGNVGVGTTTAGNQFEVEAAAADGVMIGNWTEWAGNSHAGIKDDHGHLMLYTNPHLPNGYYYRFGGTNESTSYDIGISGNIFNIGRDVFGASNTNVAFGGAIQCISDVCPTNNAIRLTPNLHLNSGGGNAVILNWDNGTTGTAQTLRIGNGASSDVFWVRANGETYAAGNVGIGSTSPGSKLDVNGAVRADAYNGNGTIQFNTNTTNDTSYEWLGYYSGGTRQGIILYDGAWTGCGNITTEFCIKSENSNSLGLGGQTGIDFYTGSTGSLKMTILTNGNVGIGHWNPQSKLSVAGNMSIGSSYASVINPETNGLIVEGNVGIGITNASQKLEVIGNTLVQGSLILSHGGAIDNIISQGAANTGVLRYTSDNTTTTELELANGSGTYHGSLYGSNGTDFGLLDNDGSWSYRTTTDTATYFYINNSIRMMINSNGNVGIGDTSPEHKLKVDGGTGYGIVGVSTGVGLQAGVYGANDQSGGFGVHGNTTNGYGVIGDSDGAGTGVRAINRSSGFALYCDASTANKCGGNQAWFNTSDRRLKKEIEPIEDALAKILNLEGVTYIMKNDISNTRVMGFIAQDTLPYAPEVVSYDEENGYYGMQTGQLTALIVEAVKQQQTQIEELSHSNLLTFDSSGELAISGSSSDYAVTPVGSSPLTNIVGASQAVVGKITAGLINTRELVVTKSAQIADLSVTNLTVSGVSLQTYVRNIVQTELQTQPTSLPEDAIAQDFNSGMVIHNYNTTVTIVQSPTASSSTTFSATSSGALAINPEINVTEVTQVIPDPRFDVLATLVSWSDSAVNGVRTLFFNAPTVFRYLAWFQGPVKVNADTSGTILIPADTLKARVSFSKPFPENPSVYVSFTDGVSIAHTITDVNASGFTINFASAPATDLTIQWLALLREDSETGPSLEIMETEEHNSQPATLPASTPTPTAEPTPEESGNTSPDPAQEPTPTPATTSSQTATPSATGFSDLLEEENIEEATEPASTASPSATP